MIVGLVSTYREGALAVGAIRSLLPAVDAVRVLDGPIGGEGNGLERALDVFAKDQRVICNYGEFVSDAEKRTRLLESTRRYPAPTWGVILDGDELLLWGEHLRAQIEHLEERERATGEVQTGCSLRLVESDGSVSQINARVLRLDLIDSYVHSSYHLRWINGSESARPNFPIVTAGMGDLPPHAELLRDLEDAPAGTEWAEMRDRLQREQDAGWMQCRRPVQGEPHILHRSILRSPNRSDVTRMHIVEHDGLAGTVGVQVETGEGVKVA